VYLFDLKKLFKSKQVNFKLMILVITFDYSMLSAGTLNRHGTVYINGG